MGNVWQTTTSRMGKWASSNLVYVVHGWSVAKPSCGSGSTPKIIVIAKGVNATYVLQNFDVVDNGATWTVNMWGAWIGTEVASGTAIAEIGCWYP